MTFQFRSAMVKMMTFSLVAFGDAFLMPLTHRRMISYLSLFNADEPVECYLIQDEDEDEYGSLSEQVPVTEKHRVVCTSSPEEYAWFNGIDEKNMIPFDNDHSTALECVEGASPRGTPEWECR